MQQPTTLERAFALARTGDYGGITEVRDQLRIEGYDLHQMEGRTLLRQIGKLCDDARR
jgi:hypothetical protein